METGKWQNKKQKQYKLYELSPTFDRKTEEKAKIYKIYVVMFSIGTTIDIQCCTRFLQYLAMFK